MPTGYAADIKDGISFRKYALNCSRAFGALIHMRDSSCDAEITQVIEPSDYHAKEITKFELELKRIRLLSEDEIKKESQEEHQKACKFIDGGLVKTLDQEKKYREMLVKVKAYQPPSSDHVEYKNFMVSQIQQSIDFDCNTSYYKYPDFIDGYAWKAGKEKKVLADIIYHKKENLKEIERCADRTTWVQQMFESLPDEE